MSPPAADVRASRPARLLNIGCGSAYHADWVNVDASPVSPDVMACDVASGLPFDDGTFDAVYASHVLEHLEPKTAIRALRDCHRVLKPGGILRIAVPDLETIARLYVSSIDEAIAGNAESEMRYDWMMLELFDQTVRNASGGEMAAYLSRRSAGGLPTFVAGRLGDEGAVPARAFGRPFAPGARLIRKLARLADAARRTSARVMAFLLLGRRGARALDIGLFRLGGEVHQWMYDRFSLARALRASGFDSIAVRRAADSDIPGFAAHGLEMVDGRERKPDSLYMEARKPAA